MFYTNFGSKKGKELKSNQKASMCFHWKSLRRQVRVTGEVEIVSDKKRTDDYFHSRPYKNKIGAWSSLQSTVMKDRNTFVEKIKKYEKKNIAIKIKYPGHLIGQVGGNSPEIEFWLDGEGRIHERLNYKKINEKWVRETFISLKRPL